MSEEYFLIDGIKFVREQGKLPDPVELPGGTIVYTGRWARVRHDKISRTLSNPNLMQTNETVVLRPIAADGNVDWRSKAITRLDQRWAWVLKFREMLGELIWSLYVQPGAGFQDTNSKPTDPDVGPFKQQSLTCGGNLLHIISGLIWTADGAYVEVEALDFYGDVPQTTWEDEPHKFTKQVVVGNNSDKETYYIAHQKNGDVMWPMVCNQRLAIALRDIEYLPELPFYTSINGVPVRIDAYCFWGSNTYGLIGENWYLLEEMVVSGIGSCTYDRRVYVDNWVETCPPPVKGFTRMEFTLTERMGAWLRKQWSSIMTLAKRFLSKG